MRTLPGRALLGGVAALGLLGGVLGYALGPAAPASATGGTPAIQSVAAPGTALILVLDLGAEVNRQAGTFGGVCARRGTVLDCEKVYTNTLTSAAAAGGAVPVVGVAGYGNGGLLADVGPAPGVQLFTGPATDADGVHGADAPQVALSAFADAASGNGAASGFRSFTFRAVVVGDNAVEAGITSAVQLARAAGRPNTIVAFLTSGAVPNPEAVAAALDTVPLSVHFYPYAIGATARCAGALQLMADLTGGKCGTPKNPFGDGNHTVFGEDGLGDLPEILRTPPR